MLIDVARLESQVAKAVASLPGTLYFQGQSYPCSVGEVSQSNDFGDQGLLRQFDVEAVFAKGALAGVSLRLEDKVEVEAYPGADRIRYEIADIERDSTSVKLGLNTPRSGL